LRRPLCLPCGPPLGYLPSIQTAILSFLGLLSNFRKSTRPKAFFRITPFTVIPPRRYFTFAAGMPQSGPKCFRITSGS
jgi:hypothetical protein